MQHNRTSGITTFLRLASLAFGILLVLNLVPSQALAEAREGLFKSSNETEQQTTTSDSSDSESRNGRTSVINALLLGLTGAPTKDSKDIPQDPEPNVLEPQEDDPGTLTVTKVFAGETLTRIEMDELNKSATFTVTKSGDTAYNKNEKLGNFTSSSDTSKYWPVDTELTAGTYHIDEDYADVPGLIRTTTYSMEVTSDTSTSPTTTTLTNDENGVDITVEDGADVNVVIRNSYSSGANLEVEVATRGASWPSGATATLKLDAVTVGAPMPRITSQMIIGVGGVKFDDITYVTTDYGKTFEYDIDVTNSTLGNEWESSSSVRATVTVDRYGRVTTEYPNGSTITFTKSDTPTPTDPAKVSFEVAKTLTGRQLRDGEFFFDLTDDNTGTLLETATNDENGKVTFREIAFYAEGVYKLTIAEIPGNESGMSYDSTECHVTVKVSNIDGKLVATPSYTKHDFSNNYKAGKKLSIPMELSKDSIWPSDTKAIFDLIVPENAPTPLKNGVPTTQVELTSAGDVDFGFLDFINTPDGTYIYTIKETTGLGPCWAASPKTKSVNVEAIVANGEVTSFKYSAAGIVNSFEPVVSLKITKALDGGSWPSGKSASFKWASSDNGPKPMKDGKEVTTITVTSAGTVDFGTLDFTGYPEGTYKYTITEDNSLGDDWTPSGSVIATATVKKDEAASISYSPDDATITNTKKDVTPTETTASIKVQKVLDGRSWTSGDSFKFKVSSSGSYGSKISPASGEIIITNADTNHTDSLDITFYEAGTYEFTVKEEKGSLSGVEYDTSSHTVKVTVTKGADNKLKATISPSSAVKITNKYSKSNSGSSTGNATAKITATKKLSGRTLSANEFSFELKDNSGRTIQTKSNASGGSITFDTIEYTSAGTYNYTITEVNNNKTGITYDTHSAQVTVTVTENSNGNLSAKTSYSNATFNNTYKDDSKTTTSSSSSSSSTTSSSTKSTGTDSTGSGSSKSTTTGSTGSGSGSGSSSGSSGSGTSGSSVASTSGKTASTGTAASTTTTPAAKTPGTADPTLVFAVPALVATGAAGIAAGAAHRRRR